MKKLLTSIFCILAVDAFFWDFTFKFLPGINSKMMLAGIGVLAFFVNSFGRHSIFLSRRVFFSGFLAAVFSLWCYTAITINGTNDMHYVRYIVSFGTWVSAAYGVYSLLKRFHDKVDLMVLMRYTAITCVLQCFLALMIDNIPAVRNAVNSIFYIPNFYERIGRLYGVGCALDPAGVRFSAILVLISHQLVHEKRVRDSMSRSGFLLFAFLVITIVGSMIARTTLVGIALGLGYLFVGNLRLEQGGYVSRIQITFSLLMMTIITAITILSIYLYNSSAFFHANLRFGFEGFFNWVETGEFRTNSTDILMNVMWVWPTDPHGWLVGYGRIGVFTWNTDIGYCNFTLYCGLIGLTIYSIYYIYNHLSLIPKFKSFTVIALLLCAVTFIVWGKVMTDIFLVDALLFCIDGDHDEA